MDKRKHWITYGFENRMVSIITHFGGGMEKLKKQNKYHSLYMDVAKRVAAMSYCNRLQVGAIAVKDDRIISMGWNGQPTGFDNGCEDDNYQTLPSVLHAESNLITKLARGHESAAGSVVYITHSPCIECAKLLAQAGIKEIFYAEDYKAGVSTRKGMAGLEFLEKCGIVATHFPVDE
jgi:dCMP deaminase